MVMYLVMLFAMKNPEEGLGLYDQPCMKIVQSPYPLKLILLSLKGNIFQVIQHAANHSLLQVGVVL